MKKILVLICLVCFVFGFSQQTEYVNFKRIEAGLDVVPDSSMVKGSFSVDFIIQKKTDSIFLNFRNKVHIDKASISYSVIELKRNGKKLKGIDNKLDFDIKIYRDGNKLWMVYDFEANQSYTISFNYSTSGIKKALYFTKRKDDWNIWTQGQGKYTSNWLPSIDDTNDKIEFDLSITYDENYTVLANGKLDSISGTKGFKTWHYNMQKPMSSYLVALVIGKYDKKTETSKSGIPLEYYYYPEDSLKVEPTYRYTKQMFDFLEEEIGFEYPWQNYKQVPVHDFLYSGMENTSLTIFSDAFVVDSIGFNDKNYVNVNAHELAHQWFGDLVTATSGEHHWLQEGFATHYALLAEKDIFGKDYYDFKLYESANDLARQDADGNGTSLLNPKASSLTFYQRGAWVLYALRHYVGHVAFKKAVVSYLEKYQYATVNTQDFLSEIERFSGKSLDKFSTLWITNKKFPFDAAVKIIYQQSEYIQEYVEINCNNDAVVYGDSTCADFFKNDISDDAKVRLIAQQPQLITKSTFNNSIKVRQAIATYLKYVPENLRLEYESLLNDKSYITIERALYNLWTSFPMERAKYLSKTRKIEGFSNKNVKLLWLALHLNTPDYNAYGKDNVFAELLNYTSNYYSVEIRMEAFKYLDLMKSCNDMCKKNLEDAKTHHNWRMVKFAKDLSNQLNKK